MTNDCELCICICICICFSEEKKMCKMNDECCIWSCLIIIVTLGTLFFSYQLALEKIQTN